MSHAQVNDMANINPDDTTEPIKSAQSSEVPQGNQDWQKGQIRNNSDGSQSISFPGKDKSSPVVSRVVGNPVEFSIGEPKSSGSQDSIDSLEAILHLNGCQQRTAGYGDAKDGKELDMEDMERLEKLTFTEVTAWHNTQLYQEILALIGEDEPEPTSQGGGSYMVCRNQFRAELRAKAKARYLKEEWHG